ncbi:MAG TPA: hypothetical protein VLJ17_11920 [Xanthobacteraceae bacterium]|nr:hypothetical protein [Xanthobacteraceae bacterium]
MSGKVGPVLSGSLALFPIALSSTGLILHRRIGGPATAAVMASAGFATGLALLHLTAAAGHSGSTLPHIAGERWMEYGLVGHATPRGNARAPDRGRPRPTVN